MGFNSGFKGLIAVIVRTRVSPAPVIMTPSVVLLQKNRPQRKASELIFICIRLVKLRSGNET